MTGRRRDVGRESVYDAERQVQRIFDRSATYPTITVAGSTIAVPVERHFGDIAGVQRYCDAILAHPDVRATWPGRATPVAVRARRGAHKAHYERSRCVVAIPDMQEGRWAMRELIVLHELSHHLSPEPGHCAAFSDTMATLAGIAIGPEAALLLRVTLADSR